MKAKINEKTNKIEFVLDKDDIRNSKLIGDLMEMEAWKILETYWKLGREEIIFSGKKGSRKRALNDLSGNRWSMLDGYDQFMDIPLKLKQEYINYLENKKREKQEEKQEVNEFND